MNERNLKIAALALAVVIVLGVFYIIFAIRTRDAGALHPRENKIASAWGNFLTEQTYEEDLTTTHEGFMIQNSGN